MKIMRTEYINGEWQNWILVDGNCTDICFSKTAMTEADAEEYLRQREARLTMQAMQAEQAEQESQEIQEP